MVKESQVKAILAMMVVGSSLVFNGISLITGRPLDPATLTLAGTVVGYYFGKGENPVSAAFDNAYDDDLFAPLAKPAIGRRE